MSRNIMILWLYNIINCYTLSNTRLSMTTFSLKWLLILLLYFFFASFNEGTYPINIRCTISVYALCLFSPTRCWEDNALLNWKLYKRSLPSHELELEDFWVIYFVKSKYIQVIKCFIVVSLTTTTECLYFIHVLNNFFPHKDTKKIVLL